MEAPPLPEREGGWSDRTLEWWKTIWASPMAILWLPADMGALHDLAELRERLSVGDQRLGGMGSVRAIEDRLGLTPKSRALLKWLLPTNAGTAHPEEPPAPPEPEKPARQASVSRLRAVDSG